MAGKFLHFIWCLGINETKMFSIEPSINEILHLPIDLQPLLYTVVIKLGWGVGPYEEGSEVV